MNRMTVVRQDITLACTTKSSLTRCENVSELSSGIRKPDVYNVGLKLFTSKGFDKCISANQSEGSCLYLFNRLCSLAVSNFSSLSNSKETEHSNSNSIMHARSMHYLCHIFYSKIVSITYD